MSELINLQLINKKIERAASKSGRNPHDISLIAVSKNIEWERVNGLYEGGQRLFGENRLIEALEKQQQAPPDCQWHFLGHLQSNKVRKMIGKFDLIHSVDSYPLAKKISDISQEMAVLTPILLQANLSGENSKQGLTSEEWKRCFENLLMLSGISIKGLMTMAPLIQDEKEIRKCFRELRELKSVLQLMAGNEISLDHLSMGMSNDFEAAIEEGATLVRIGTALFS